MHTIRITVRNYIAKAEKKVYVCGNSKYNIEFDFDAEWEPFSKKTARFSYNGRHDDVIFTGNTCNIPKILNTDEIRVGVYAGDLLTTTPATIITSKSILCDGGVPADPPDDVYNQIMHRLNELGTPGPEEIAAAVADYIAANPIEEKDPTVPAWAKAKKKPEYSAEEVGAIAKTKLQAAIDTALEQAKASGEFDGADGKSAYQYAQDGGYTGTETEFAEKLAKEIPEALPNPNALTFTGAVNATYDGSTAVSVEIPSGGSGGTDISLGLTSAAVGQTIKVKAIDESGKPTAWEAANMPSGGGGERWRLVRTITLEENVTVIDISEDNDGNPFALKKIRIYGNTLGTASGGQLRINVANKTDDTYSILGPYYNFKGLDTTKRQWVAESEFFNIINGKGNWSEWYNTPDTVGAGVAYARAGLRTPKLDNGQYLQDRVEFLYIFSNTSGVEFAAGSYIELWGVDA